MSFNVKFELARDIKRDFATRYDNSTARGVALRVDHYEIQSHALLESCDIFYYDKPTIRLSDRLVHMSLSYSSGYTDQKSHIPDSPCDLLISPLEIERHDDSLRLLNTTAPELNTAVARLITSQSFRPRLEDLLNSLSKSLSSKLSQSIIYNMYPYSHSESDTVTVYSPVEGLYLQEDELSFDSTVGGPEISIRLTASTIYGHSYNSLSKYSIVNICRHVLISGEISVQETGASTLVEEELVRTYNNTIVMRGG